MEPQTGPMQPRPGPTLPLLSRLSFSLDLTHTGPKGQQYSSDIILAPCTPSCGCASGTRGNCQPSLLFSGEQIKRNAFLSSSLPFLFSSFSRPNLPLYPSNKMHSVVLTGLSCHLRTSGSPVSLRGPGVEKVQHPFLQYQKFCFL